MCVLEPRSSSLFFLHSPQSFVFNFEGLTYSHPHEPPRPYVISIRVLNQKPPNVSARERGGLRIFSAHVTLVHMLGLVLKILHILSYSILRLITQ